MQQGQYEDMSPWAVHFTTPDRKQPTEEPLQEGWSAGLLDFLERRRLEDTTGYWNSLSILGSGFIRPFADPHGAGKDVPEVAERHRSCALSEVPLHLLGRLINNRSLYGVGFHQDVLIRKGGARVWYVEDPGPIAATIQGQVQTRVDAGVDPGDSFWRITPFIDFAKPGSVWEDWRWEREWRVPGGLRFNPENVAFPSCPRSRTRLPASSSSTTRLRTPGRRTSAPTSIRAGPRTGLRRPSREVPLVVEPLPDALDDPFDDWNEPHRSDV
jgi:hypothetical protein